ncbi:MAG TPA: hypothetical protein VGT05_00885 [Patescibacteria group bacterium]|nr:hypothetical protein [Patescibacteria group bacterium]
MASVERASTGQGREASNLSAVDYARLAADAKLRIADAGKTKSSQPELTPEQQNHLLVNRPDFTFVDGKPQYTIDQPFFWYYHSPDLTVYKPSPLMHAEVKGHNLPLAFEYLTKVTDDATQRDVYYRVITKGVPLEIQDSLEQENNSTYYASEELKKAMDKLRKQKSQRRSATQISTNWFMEREEHYYFDKTGRLEWQNSVFSSENKQIVQLVHVERLDPTRTIVPEDLPDEAAIRRTMLKLNQRLNLNTNENVIQKMAIPETDPLPKNLSEQKQKEELERRKPFGFRGWNVFEQREIQTPFATNKLYTLRLMTERNGTRLFIKLLSAEPLREKLRELAKKDQERPEGSREFDFIPVSENKKLVSLERVCSCMGARRGCDCYEQMPERVAATLRENGVMVLLQLDQSMAYGAPINALEYKQAAIFTNTLDTGKAPGKADKVFHTTMPIRKGWFGENTPKDLTAYKDIGELIIKIFGPHREKEEFYEMITDNAAKLGSIESWGLKVKRRKSEKADAEVRKAKAEHLDYLPPDTSRSRRTGTTTPSTFASAA